MEEHEEPSGIPVAVVVAGAVLLLLLLCGGGAAFVGFRLFMAAEDAAAAEEAALEEAQRAKEAEMRAAIEAAAAERMHAEKLALGGDVALTRERLAGARAESIDAPPQLIWDFVGDRFTLRVSGEPAPRFLLDTLLGPGKSASRIEGRWRLSEDGRALELSDITGDGQAGSVRVSLMIRPAGAVRIELAERQYILLPGAAQAPPKKE